VRIGYADSTGTTTERVVEPLRLEGGFLTAYDLRTAEVRTFTVARITGVSPVADRLP
jgi:predicted DNA-binding transcriptional regulator YafY